MAPTQASRAESRPDGVMMGVSGKKKVCLALWGISSVLALATSCKHPAHAPGTPPQSSIEVRPMLCDVGIVDPEDGPAKAVFYLVNTGAQASAIAHIYTSCACTMAELAKRTLAPGEQTSLTVGVRVALNKKEFTHSVRLATTEPGAPLVTARIIGEVDAGVLLNTEKLEFGSHSIRDFPLVQNVYAHEVTDRIKQVDTTVEGLTLGVTRGNAQSAGKGSGNLATIEARLGTGEPGLIDGVVKIHTEQGREYTLPVKGSVVAAVRSLPYCLMFVPKGDKAAAQSLTVTVVNDFQALPREVSAPAFLGVSLAKVAPGESQLRVTWDPQVWQHHATPEKAEVSVLFEDRQELRIPVYFWR